MIINNDLKKEPSISAAIKTILMVALVVILAAVVGVLVMGMVIKPMIPRWPHSMLNPAFIAPGKLLPFQFMRLSEIRSRSKLEVKRLMKGDTLTGIPMQKK